MVGWSAVVSADSLDKLTAALKAVEMAAVMAEQSVAPTDTCWDVSWVASMGNALVGLLVAATVGLKVDEKVD